MSRIRDRVEQERRRVLSNRRDDSPYYDTMDTLFDLAKLFKRDDAIDRQNITSIFELSKLVNSPTGYDKVENMVSTQRDSIGTDSEFSPYLDIIDKNIKDRRGLYNAGLKNLENIDKNQDNYKLSADEAEKWPIEKLVKEYENSLDLQFSMNQTVDNKYTYKTVPMTPFRAQKTINNYVATLDDAIKYHTQNGHIPSSVAKALAANNFPKAQQDAMSIAQREGDDARSLYKHYDRAYQSILKMERKKVDDPEGYDLYEELLRANIEENSQMKLPIDPVTKEVDFEAAKREYKNDDKTGLLDIQSENISSYKEMTRIWSPVDIPSVTKDLDSSNNSPISKEIQALKDEYGYSNPAANNKTMAEQSGNWDNWTEEGKIAAVKWELENPDASLDEVNEHINFMLENNYARPKKGAKSSSMPENRAYLNSHEKMGNLTREQKLDVLTQFENNPNMTNKEIDAMLDDFGTPNLDPLEKLKQRAKTIKSKNLTKENVEDTVKVDTSIKKKEEQVKEVKKAEPKSYGESFEREFLKLPSSQGSMAVSPRDALNFKKKYKLNRESYSKLKQIFDITNRLKTPENYKEKQIASYEAQLVKLRNELEEKLGQQAKYGTWSEMESIKRLLK